MRRDIFNAVVAIGLLAAVAMVAIGAVRFWPQLAAVIPPKAPPEPTPPDAEEEVDDFVKSGVVTCRWACDDPVCQGECQAMCDAPVCGGGLTNCIVVCPTDQVADSDCPTCEIKCGENHDVSPSAGVCDAVNCAWSCRPPTVCPKPQCELQCISSCAAPSS